MPSLRTEIRPAVQPDVAHEQAQGADAVSDLPPGAGRGAQHATAHGVQTRPVQTGGGQAHQQESQTGGSVGAAHGGTGSRGLGVSAAEIAAGVSIPAPPEAPLYSEVP